MATEAEKEFQEWQRQLALRCAASEPLEFETWGDLFDHAIKQAEKEMEPIYPYMACSRQYESMDPLEGCSECGGVGYHVSIPNPDWSDPKLEHRRWNNIMRKMEGEL